MLQYKRTSIYFSKKKADKKSALHKASAWQSDAINSLLQLHFPRRRCNSGNSFLESSIKVDHASLSSYLNTYVSFNCSFIRLPISASVFLRRGNQFKELSGSWVQLCSFFITISKVLCVCLLGAPFLIAFTQLPAGIHV